MKTRASETEKLLDRLFDAMEVREKDVLLIRLYARRTQDPEEWADFFRQVDFEEETYVFNYLLSRLGAKFDWQGIPPELVPRLKGLRKKLTMKNLVLLSDALLLMRTLADAGIPMLMVKGGAMRLALLPDVPRRMLDVDLVVPEARYAEAVQIARDNGFEVFPVVHSTGIEKNGESCADIHFRVFKGNAQRDEPTELFADKAHPQQKNGVSFYIPTPEDAFLHIAVSAVEDYLYRSGKGPLLWLADCVDLAQRYALSWESMADRAALFGVREQFRTAVLLMRRYLPDAFPELYRLMDGALSGRTLRRLKGVLINAPLTEEEQRTLPAWTHFLRSSRFYFAQAYGIYNLDDPGWVVLKGYPAVVKTILGIDSFRRLPGVFINKIRTWVRQNEERETE